MSSNGTRGSLTLDCLRCAQTVSAAGATWRCPTCGGPLRWDGPSAFSRDQINPSLSSLWRYAAVLPVQPETAVTLGESITPLVEAEVDGVAVQAKLDFLLPTGSYKDRGAAILISHLRGLGVQRGIEDSSGNAAAAIAAYCARAGIACTVYAPATASRGKLVQAAAYGARVERVAGTRGDVATAAMQAAATEADAAYASHNWHPFFIEGVKTWALEVWEQLSFRSPDNVVVPAGSGSMLLGAYLAFRQLRAGGEITRLPRLFAIQATACAPLQAAFISGADDVSPVEREPSIAEGIMIAQPVRGRELLAALRGTDGATSVVSEPEIAAAVRALARQGLYVEPTAAVAAAGCRLLLTANQIRPDQTTVIMLSGSGLKATDTIGTLLDAQPATP